MSYYDNNYNDYNQPYQGGYNRGRGRRGGGRRGRRGGRGRGYNNYGGYGGYGGQQQQYQQRRNYGNQQQSYQSHSYQQQSGIEYPPNLNELLRNINKKDKNDIIEIDGSKLEGGGQTLRNSMTFAALLKQPIHIIKIRGNRPKPGLAPQHLQGIILTQKIFGGYLSGAYFRSTEVLYIPEKCHNGNKCDFMVDTETAGSICLLLQSSLPLLFYMNNQCNIVLKGGTNVSFAPQIDYFNLLVKPMFEKLFQLRMNVTVNKRGLYPKGGGEVTVTTQPILNSINNNNNSSNNDPNDQKVSEKNDNNINSGYVPCIDLCKRGKLSKIHGLILLAGNNLDMSIGDEIRKGVLAQLCENNEFKQLINSNNNNNNGNSSVDIRITREWSQSYGTCIVIVAETENGCMLGGSAIGKVNAPNRGRNNRNNRNNYNNRYNNNRNDGGNVDHSEVGRNAGKELLRDWNYGENACTDRHFQDQLIVFMALAKGNSKFKSCEMELHTETAIHFAELLTAAKFKVTKENDGVLIECEGIGLRAGGNPSN